MSRPYMCVTSKAKAHGFVPRATMVWSVGQWIPSILPYPLPWFCVLTTNGPQGMNPGVSGDTLTLRSIIHQTVIGLFVDTLLVLRWYDTSVLCGFHWNSVSWTIFTVVSEVSKSRVGAREAIKLLPCGIISQFHSGKQGPSLCLTVSLKPSYLIKPIVRAGSGLSLL